MENKDANIAFLEFPRTAPSRPFAYPHQLVMEPGIDPAEKRAILSAWASDANAVASLPALRHLPGTPRPVTFSSIMDALAALDRMTGNDDDDPPPRLSPAAMRPRRPPERRAA